MFDLDIAAKHVNALITAAQCNVCGKLGEKRLRYSCGHSACENCVASSKHCYYCLSLSPDSSPPGLDVNLTEQLTLANNIFNTFQNTFGINVSKRPRLSEQLKLEKELFPECIQAVHKYENKRRSNEVIKFKENSPVILPGEITNCSNIKKMDKSKYVQNWLDNSQSVPKSKRAPFTDLDANNLRFSNRSTKQTRNYTKQHENKTKPLSLIKKTNKIENIRTPRKTLKAKNENKKKKDTHLCDKKENEKIKSRKQNTESVILIEDSQSEFVDKDLQAWQAVVQAHNEEVTDIENDPSQNLIQHDNHLIHPDLDYGPQNKTLHDIISTKLNSHNNTEFIVPFIKRSKLTETCKKCLLCYKTNTEVTTNKSTTDQLNPSISITIMSNTSTTVMKVQRNRAKLITVESKAVQTDLSDEEIRNDEHVTEHFEGASQDVFKSLNKVPKSIVSDADTESIDEHGYIMTVEALVHNSSQESNSERRILERRILGEITPTRTVRPTKRRYTPNSSDSSEKENKDPNRRRRINFGKKRKKNC